MHPVPLRGFETITMTPSTLLGLTSQHLTLIAAACEESAARWEAQAATAPNPTLVDHLHRQAKLAKEISAIADHITFEWVNDPDADPLDWDGEGRMGQEAYGCIARRRRHCRSLAMGHLGSHARVQARHRGRITPGGQMSQGVARYRVGDKFNLAPDALDNYRVAEGPYTVRAVYTHYCKPAQMGSDPTGHPGFDPNGGSPLYSSIELPFDVYEWEMRPA